MSTHTVESLQAELHHYINILPSFIADMVKARKAFAELNSNETFQSKWTSEANVRYVQEDIASTTAKLVALASGE